MILLLQGLLTLFSFPVIFPVNGLSGGSDTTINRHPCLLSLQHGGVHFCGATLITSQWAVTSAQCATKYIDLAVRAGSNRTTTGGHVYDVDKIVVHPQFNKQTLDSDLALLKISREIKVDHAFPTGLPEADEEIDIKPYTTIHLYGWGYTSSSSNRFADILQTVDVPPKTSTECREKYTGKLFTDNMWCAGFDKINITSCNGDFGGPALIIGTIYGVQSWGGSCGDPSHPSVFVKVSKYVPWINETAGPIYTDSFSEYY